MSKQNKNDDMKVEQEIYIVLSMLTRIKKRDQEVLLHYMPYITKICIKNTLKMLQKLFQIA